MTEPATAAMPDDVTLNRLAQRFYEASGLRLVRMTDKPLVVEGLRGVFQALAEASAATRLSTEEVNALPIGSVIVMHHKDAEPAPHPGCTWFRIERGWINAYGSEVPVRPDWPHVGELGGASAVTAAFRADV